MALVEKGPHPKYSCSGCSRATTATHSMVHMFYMSELPAPMNTAIPVLSLLVPSTLPPPLSYVCARRVVEFGAHLLWLNRHERINGQDATA